MSFDDFAIAVPDHHDIESTEQFIRFASTDKLPGVLLAA
jgi:hypothetical protein